MRGDSYLFGSLCVVQYLQTLCKKYIHSKRDQIVKSNGRNESWVVSAIVCPLPSPVQ